MLKVWSAHKDHCIRGTRKQTKHIILFVQDIKIQCTYYYIPLSKVNGPLHIKDKYSVMELSNVRAIYVKPSVMYSLCLCITTERLLESQLMLTYHDVIPTE